MSAKSTLRAAVPSPTSAGRWPGLLVLLGVGLAAYGGYLLAAAIIAALPLGSAGGPTLTQAATSARPLSRPTGAVTSTSVTLAESDAALDATNVRQQLLIGSQPGQPPVLATPIDYQFDVFHNVGQQLLIGSTPRPLPTLGPLPSTDSGPAGQPIGATE